MPRHPDPASRAEFEAESSARLQRIAHWAALALALLAPVLAAWALLRTGGAAPGAGEAWLIALAVAMACGATGWSLWRQSALERLLRGAREEARAALQLGAAARWEADGAQRLASWRPAQDGTAAGVAPEDIGRPLWDIFASDAAAAAVLRDRMQSGLPFADLRVALPGRSAGSVAPHRFSLQGQPLTDARGGVQRWLGSAQQLDTLEDADRDRSLLQSLLDALPLPVFELVGDAGGIRQLRRANAAGAQCLGARPEELAGLPCAELIARLARDVRAAVAEAVAQAPRGNAAPPCPGWQIRLESVPGPATAGGAAADRQWLLILLPAGRAGAEGAAAAATDAESFSYTVSHDLRAPVRVVEGFTRILKEDYGRHLDRIGNDHLDRVLGAAARMNAMIDALLALAQLSSRPLSRQPVNLSQLASYVVEDLRRQSPERQVGVHLQAGLQAQGDPTLLRVVLENLIGNAWKYSARTRQAQIWIERGQHAGQAVFTVRDNGAGFDMRFADRLFGVFQRLHSASDFPGTGIGLATVRRIVQRHGGEIWAESEVDRGSSFHFTIPPAGAPGA